MRFSLPKQVILCLTTLENAGYEAFCVGGAVRDMLMGNPSPSDFDITTNCTPDGIVEIFPHTIPTGIDHGTVTVLSDGMPIEVTTYRVEGGYADSRHPDKVSFVGNIEDDLSRRDFTVNAIAYNEKTGIFDPFSGLDDIKDGILRTVGDPHRRFSEDALRIMRLYRFASKLGFSPVKETRAAAEELMPLLQKISAERIFSELCGMLCGKLPENADGFFSLGALEFLGLKKCSIGGFNSLPADRSIRFAALMLRSGSDSKEVLSALRADNKLKSEVAALCELCGRKMPENKVEIKLLLREYGEEIFEKYLSLSAFTEGCDTAPLGAMFSEITANCEPYKISALAIGGDDVKALGYSGREIGRLLERLLLEVIKDPEKNKPDTLKKLITK